MKAYRKKITRMVLVPAAVLILLLIGSVPAYASGDGEMAEEVKAYAEMYRVSEDEVIADGVSVGGVDIGGLTLLEAAQAIDARQQEMLDSSIVFVLQEEKVTYTMRELGLTFVNPSEEVVRAACLGKSGQLIARYKATKDIAAQGYDMPMIHYAERSSVTELIAKFAAEVNQSPIEATITKVDSGFNVTHEQTGFSVDEEATVAVAMTAVEQWDGVSDLTIKAEGEVTEPVYTYEMLSTITDCLGSFKTICGDLDTPRGRNVIIGAGKMNGNIVLPGESYSVVDVLAPFDLANGYEIGVAYMPDGSYIDSIGGGVCSLSTTLYNAALRAELDIEKRWNHSMIVSYVDWGFDATVNDDGSRDLVFTNNYDTPIYIEVYTVNSKPDGWLYFNIYGKETRDMSRRKLVFYNNVLEVDYPTREEFRFYIDESLPVGSEEWDQGNYPYAKVEAYKEIWIDGVLQEKILLSVDTYKRSPAIVRHNPGTGAPAQPEPEPEPEPQPEPQPAPETEAPTGQETSAEIPAQPEVPAESGSQT